VPVAPGAGIVRGPWQLFRGYAFDLDGGAYQGNALLPGADTEALRIREAHRLDGLRDEQPAGDGGRVHGHPNAPAIGEAPLQPGEARF